MTTVFVILAIIWILVPLYASKKQKQMKEQAARERAARQRAAAEAAAAQAAQRPAGPMRTTPLAPTVRPSQSYAPPSMEGVGSQEGRAGKVLEGELPHEVNANLKDVNSSLRELNVSISHVVTASSQTGHAHQETSITGIQPTCPPDSPTAAPDTVVRNAESAFVWNADDVRSGLVMAEILGPCLALRD